MYWIEVHWFGWREAPVLQGAEQGFEETEKREHRAGCRNEPTGDFYAITCASCSRRAMPEHCTARVLSLSFLLRAFSLDVCFLRNRDQALSLLGLARI
jgi:hypothetical protein